MADETIPQGDVSTPETDESIASAAFGEGGDAPAAEPVQDESGDTPAATADGSEGTIEYLDQLASEIGVEPDALRSGIKVKIKVDGEEKDVTLADLIKVNQLEGHVNKKSIELSEARKAFDAESAKARQDWAQRVQFAGQVLDSQEAQLNQQYQSVNWNALMQQDSTQYMVLRQQFQDAASQIAMQKQALAQHWQQTQAQMREQARPRALEAIRTQFPDLADPVSYGNALGEIKSYLKGIGANEANFDAVELDPVVFRVARDAARYQAIAAKQPQIAQKLRTAPKFERASAKDSVPAKQAAMNSLRKRADAGDESALAELLFRS